MSPLTYASSTANRARRRECAAGRGGGTAGLLWLTWRQHRWVLIGSIAIAVVLTAAMAYLAADLTSIYHQCHNTLCASGTTQAAALSASFGPLSVSRKLMQFVEYVPLLIGMFLGVPLLAREHEQRTLLLAWSQDISPARWLWTKLALLGTVVVVLTAAISAASDHLAHVITHVSTDSLFVNALFLDSGMLPLALSVCWFAVGVALGAATRRMLPAVICAIAGFIVLVQLVQWRYPTLKTPVSGMRPVGAGGPGPDLGANALLINGGVAIGPGRVTNLFDSSGHALSYTGLQAICPGLTPDNLLNCMTRQHVQTFVRFQPASRIAEFHLIVAVGYLGIGALALLAVGLIVGRTSLSAG